MLGRQGQMTPTSISTPDQMQRSTMSSVLLLVFVRNLKTDAVNVLVGFSALVKVGMVLSLIKLIIMILSSC